MNGICYIIGAGLIDDMTLEPAEHDYVIAADAGYLPFVKPCGCGRSCRRRF